MKLKLFFLILHFLFLTRSPAPEVQLEVQLELELKLESKLDGSFLPNVTSKLSKLTVMLHLS